MRGGERRPTLETSTTPGPTVASELARRRIQRETDTAMRLRHAVAISASIAALAFSGQARAEDPQGFIEHQHEKLMQLLHAPESPSRDQAVNKALDGFVDYDELVHRSFGEPCHPSMPSCDDLWAKYSDDQKATLQSLLKQVVENSYRRNLTKTLDYDVSYKGSKEAGGDTRVLTEAKSKSNPRDTPVRVDYVVKQTPKGLLVVDIVTEGSSFSKNLYVQFRKYMQDADGYDHIVTKLREKAAKKD